MLKVRIRTDVFNDRSFRYTPEYKGCFFWNPFMEYPNEEGTSYARSFNLLSEAEHFLDIVIAGRIAHSYTVAYPGKEF